MIKRGVDISAMAEKADRAHKHTATYIYGSGFDYTSVDTRARIQDDREKLWKEGRAMRAQSCATRCALDHAEDQLRQAEKLASDPGQGPGTVADVFAECQCSLNLATSLMAQSKGSLERCHTAFTALVQTLEDALAQIDGLREMLADGDGQ